ncbi:clathrin light chain isoform X2 [Spodoptera litura]|uniref:Clathrin light chain n=2 Tax=Spodoptera TaxID=7106 RepID=A0A9J7EKG4_SPOLT|nr:clathrin light chain isoform X2 [Spodoptera litura]XP_035431200.1 clathrin light chain isoform X2 [Spodoptera frugiperda]AZG02840.1 clathrin light chain isoform X2 [Spodoptera frugiperda]
MDDFGDNFVQPEVDPAAEFLAREQNQLAGLEDELETSAPPPIVSSSNGLDDFVEVPSASAFDSNGLLDEEPIQTSVFKQEREEPEKIRAWREEQKKRLEEKDAEEEKKKEEMLKIAKKELEDWYKTHEETIAKTKAANRNAEKALARGSEGTVEDGNEWERVAELCDFGPRRGRDVARLRSIVLQLKQSGVRPKHPPRTTKVA